MKKEAGGVWNTTIRRGSNHERNREKKIENRKSNANVSVQVKQAILKRFCYYSYAHMFSSSNCRERQLPSIQCQYLVVVVFAAPLLLPSL
jgi:hypothetical protein